jgi:hypothetical protein
MATRSRSSVRVRRSRSVSKSARKMGTKSPRKMRSKSPRKMRSKSPRKTASRRMSRRTRRSSSKMSEYQKWLKAHAAEITAAWKATGSKKIGDRAKIAKKMAMEAGVQTKPKSAKAPKRVRGTMTRRRRASGLRKFKAGAMSQTAEQKLRALLSRSPTAYTFSKGGSRVVRKRAGKKVMKLRKTKSPRKPRSPTKYNMFIKQRKAEINAEVARRGMKGMKGAFLKVASEMFKASGF